MMTISTSSLRVISCTGRTEQWYLVKQGVADCILVNNSWCTIFKEVSSYCSPEVEYLMISCRPHYLPREFSSVFFVAVDIPPQSEAGTNTALNQLCSAISKQENTHPEVALLVAGDFNAGKLKLVLPNFYQHVICATRGEKNPGPPLLLTQRHVQSSPSPSIWQI
jgi:hypothetical protein